MSAPHNFLPPTAPANPGRRAVSTYVVTGCAGFIGSHLSEALLARGDDVSSVARGSYPELAAKGVTVHRADLLDVLARALPTGLVTLGKRCTQVRPDSDVAVARFADGSEIEADIIVGADGIHSPVRAGLFGPDSPRFTGKICYRSVVPAEAVRGERPSTHGAQWPRAEGAQWLGPHGTIVLYPLRGEELINVVCHYDDASYRHESWINECDREEVLARYAGWHESLLRVFEAGDTWYKWALYDRDPIAQWTRGRITAISNGSGCLG